jgi:hypothetical protein
LSLSSFRATRWTCWRRVLTLEVDLALKVVIIQDLHRDLPSHVRLLELRVVELEVVRDGPSGQLDLLVPPRSKGGGESPVGDKDGEGGEDEEDPVDAGVVEEGGEGPLEELGEGDDEAEEGEVGEGGGTFGGEGVRVDDTWSDLVRVLDDHLETEGDGRDKAKALAPCSKSGRLANAFHVLGSTFLVSSKRGFQDVGRVVHRIRCEPCNSR